MDGIVSAALLAGLTGAIGGLLYGLHTEDYIFVPIGALGMALMGSALVIWQGDALRLFHWIGIGTIPIAVGFLAYLPLVVVVNNSKQLEPSQQTVAGDIPSLHNYLVWLILGTFTSGLVAGLLGLAHAQLTTGVMF